MRDALSILPIPGRLLAALLLILALLMAPHVSNLNPLVLGFFYLAVAWRMLALRFPAAMPGRWWLLLLMAVAIGLVISSTGLYDGRLAGTALLVVMLGLKLLELRARRDIHVTIFLGYFLVLTQFLYKQSLPLAIYLFLGVLALNTIQVGLNRVRVEDRIQLRSALGMFAAAIPLALVVFLLFPRLQHPLWGINTSTGTTGITDEMTLGNIGKLGQSNATAMRVHFDDRIPAPNQRYWRGPVLWETDGRRWSGGQRRLAARGPVEATADALMYEVTLEPTAEYWLFGLDSVVEPPRGTHINRDRSLVNANRINKRLSYRARSDPTLRFTALSERERELGLQLPDRVSARVRTLVERWQRESDTQKPLQIVAKALDYFRSEPFVYTLSPGKLDGDPIEQFLFETRRGFCEHYAGSFALLMRLAGIPSRVVIGYQGGEKNPHADHWLIRQSDAHAWNEVWIHGLGWWRVDPTAAVAPQRIERPINNSLSADSDEVVFRASEKSFFGQIMREAGWLADAVDLGWHRWVVGFSAERQRSLLDTLGLKELKGIALGAALLLGAVLAFGLVYLFSRLPKPRLSDPLPMIWYRLRKKLRRAGLDAPAWQGPDTICRHAAEAYPAQADQLFAISRLYTQLRYGRNTSAAQHQALRKRVRGLRLSRRRDTVHPA